VGIVTHPEHRKQGLATIVACALVERAQFLGFERIGWHCWEKNRASSALAQKIGFEHNVRYPVFTGRI
jgi:RimJ/RimL family protein N-acetyltransferase